MDMVKMTQQDNNDIQKALTILAEKQRRYIELAKSSSSFEDERVEKPLAHENRQISDVSLGEKSAAETKRVEIKEEKEAGIAAATAVDTQSQSGDKDRKVRKAKIPNPDHSESSIDLNEIIRINKTEAQIIVSKAKEKNKDFIDAIFDY